MIKVWVGPKLMVFLVDPRDVEIILSSHVHIDKSDEYRFFRPWFGKSGLLISTGIITFLTSVLLGKRCANTHSSRPG